MNIFQHAKKVSDGLYRNTATSAYYKKKSVRVQATVIKMNIVIEILQ